MLCVSPPPLKSSQDVWHGGDTEYVLCEIINAVITGFKRSVDAQAGL